MKKIIGIFCLGALSACMIPYRFKKDSEAGTLEVRSLLWGVRKTYGESKNYYSFAIPASGLDFDDDEDEPEEYES